MAKKQDEKLTAKQENFAFDVGYNCFNYTEAYREHYKTDSMKKSTLWRKSHEVATNGKVAARIDYWKRERILEARRKSSWTLDQGEKELLAIIKKNRKDLDRAEEKGVPVPVGVSQAIINAVKTLNERYDKLEQEYNELEQRKLLAEIESLEKKNKILDNNNTDSDKMEINITL
jgi:hypothetical protein